MFNNFFGKGYGDSPKYIAEEVLRRGLPFDLVWLVNDMTTELPKGIRKVCLISVRASFELSTAGVIVSNVKGLLPYMKRPSQYYIQTWHGSVAFKKIEMAAARKLDRHYVSDSMADSKQIDLFLSCNSIQTEEIRNFFWYDGEIFEIGTPRNDMLFSGSDVKKRIKQGLGLSLDTKIVVYAPTFRDDFRTDIYSLNLIKACHHLGNRFGGNWTALVRLHPNVKGYTPIANGDKVIDVTTYSDMQELLLIADVLITDYSSTIYDSAIMRRLVLLYAPDLDDYKAQRGLNQVYYDFPTSICTTEEELFAYIDRLDIDSYQKGLRVFFGKFKSFDDGQASKRVVDRIQSVINVDA